MKKKLLVIVTALCMVMSGAVPAFADGTVSEDVQAAYDAYRDMEKAMYTTGIYADMVAAFDILDEKSTVIGNDEAKSAEWQEKVANEVGLDKFINDTINVGLAMVVFEIEILGEPGLIADYKAAPDMKKAYDLVEIYEVLEADNVLMDKLAASIDEADTSLSRKVVDTYKAAEDEIKDVSPDVIAVYEAYVLVDDAVTDADPEAFDEAISEFQKSLDIFNNELDDNEKADLAKLMGASNWEEAYSMILGDWININVAEEMVDLYEAFNAAPNKETAKALVERYDSIYNDPTSKDEELGNLIYDCIGEDTLKSAYDEALKILNGGDAGGSSDAIPDPGNKTDSNGKSPDTGDGFNVLPFVAVMAIAVLVMGIVISRRR